MGEWNRRYAEAASEKEEVKEPSQEGGSFWSRVQKAKHADRVAELLHDMRMQEHTKCQGENALFDVQGRILRAFRDSTRFRLDPSGSADAVYTAYARDGVVELDVALAPYSDVNKSDCDFSCLAEGATVGEFIAELPEEFTAKAPPVPIVWSKCWLLEVEGHCVSIDISFYNDADAYASYAYASYKQSQQAYKEVLVRSRRDFAAVSAKALEKFDGNVARVRQFARRHNKCLSPFQAQALYLIFLQGYATAAGRCVEKYAKSSRSTTSRSLLWTRR